MHNPQPVQTSVTVIVSPAGASAGQPMSRHTPQRLQRSSSTTISPAFSRTIRTQGARATITPRPGLATSALIAASSAG